MVSRIAQFIQQWSSGLSSAAHGVFRRLTQPARPNAVTGTLAELPRSRTERLAENAMWRQPLIVLHRQVKTPRLRWWARLALLILARWVPNGQHVLHISKPGTLWRWQRQGF